MKFATVAAASVSASALLFARANAHDDEFEHRRRHYEKMIAARQDPGATAVPYPTGAAYEVPPLPSITPLAANYAENRPPAPNAIPAGTTPPLVGAPPIPAFEFIPSEWPADSQRPPPVDSPQVQGWLRELEGHNIPGYTPNPNVDCSDPLNAAAYADAGAGGRCWWSCGLCTRSEDISTCSNTWDYGLTFDDGPHWYSPKLWAYLESERLKATFFVVGKKVIEFPEYLRYEHATGHELAVHTWTHLPLTTLTTAEIVSELAWCREAIRRVTGVTPRYMRPPYGDIDDRVRAISHALGLIPVLWTGVTYPETGEEKLWDSNDWRVHDPASGVTAPQAIERFQSVLDDSDELPHGAIVLHHDIYIEAIDLAVGYSLPYALRHNPPFNIQPVSQCRGHTLAEAYVETSALEGGNNSTGSSSTRSGTSSRATSTSTAGNNNNSGAMSSVSRSVVGSVAVAIAGVIVGGLVL